MMRVLVATDAWTPQVNGVVRTLQSMAQAAGELGVEVCFLTPERFRTVPLPTYPGIRIALPSPRSIERYIAEARVQAIHIATEGPIGLMVRRYCRQRRLPFTTSFHTRFPEYIAARLPIPQSWVWEALRRFHGPAAAVMAATPELSAELTGRGFSNVRLWPRGVDTDLFRPRAGADLGLPRPVFLSVGRLAVEKNIETFLSLDLPGTKVVVGDGPQREELTRRFPNVVFLGTKQGEALAEVYASADVFVFPSHTDTYGLVMLEALACGVPVAAFPVRGPVDVIGQAQNSVGVLDHDLRAACLAALNLSRKTCREFAQGLTWEASACCFLGNLKPLPEAPIYATQPAQKRVTGVAKPARRISPSAPAQS
jgi:glycosyltransferase involved in cell wall biosynthesis